MLCRVLVFCYIFMRSLNHLNSSAEFNLFLFYRRSFTNGLWDKKKKEQECPQMTLLPTCRFFPSWNSIWFVFMLYNPNFKQVLWFVWFESSFVFAVTKPPFIQNELEYEPEETSIPAPMQEFHHNHQFAPPNVHTSSAALAPSSHIAQHYDFNQEKVFLTQPNGLSSPVRRTLQDFSLREAEPGNHHHPNSTGQGFF